jgi:hypothetical protein
MRTGITVHLNPTNRKRLQVIVDDRNSPQMLIFSPRNMASIRARRPDSSPRSNWSVQVKANRPDRQTLTALRIVCKKLPQMQL